MDVFVLTPFEWLFGPGSQGGMFRCAGSRFPPGFFFGEAVNGGSSEASSFWNRFENGWGVGITFS